MAKDNSFNIDHLWALARVGHPSLSPDGTTVVAAVTTPSMQDNTTHSALWLMSMRGDQRLRLTHCGENDGHPRFSPRGNEVAFTAKREQEGSKDESPQLYVMPTHGGEARRAGHVATGVEAFRWFPDGKRVAFVSWVWPDEKGSQAQAKRSKDFKDRKETGYATSEATYRYWDHNLPMQKVAHLHVMDLASGHVDDAFEGTPFELSRSELDADSLDVAPDGKTIAFAFDPLPVKHHDHCFALAEWDVKRGSIQTIAHHKAWDFGHPSYSPDGTRIAFIASHQQRKHTMPGQLAVLDRRSGRWDVVSAQWDHAVEGPLRWSDDGSAVLLLAEQQGRRHLWRFDLGAQRADVLVSGSWLEGYDTAAGALVSLMHSASHPGRLHAHEPGHAPLRIETFNDDVLSSCALGRVEERWIKGAQGDRVQVWMTYPSAFDTEMQASGKRKKAGATRRWPVMHVIHGGPHTSFGDAWHYRWNTQVFAAQGYVVACVNYHGSTGFGYAFTDAITHRWAELELQDIEATTDALLKEPWVDPKRIYATGGSYGGYMVAWMNGHIKAGRYAAYVCHAGCYDWPSMMAGDAYTWFPKELGATPWDDPKKVANQSPSTYAAKMQTPTLVIHGALDYRVPDAQGLAYYNTLKMRGVDARFLWFPDENHWILKPRNSKQWYGEFFDWLQNHSLDAAPSKPKKAASSKTARSKR